MSDDDLIITEAALVVRDALRARFKEVRALYAANVEACARIRYGLDDPRDLNALMEQKRLLGRELNTAYKALREIAP